MINRERILDAAARVYAKHGFRGATTRLIAIEAGVNEVTLFRTFGSKAALMHAVLAAQRTDTAVVPTLPETPVEPLEELTAFVEAIVQKLREVRPLLAHAMSEFDERPEAADFARCGRSATHEQLWKYAQRLPIAPDVEPTDVDTAVTMLASTIMGEVMGRPMAPDSYPPIDEAVRRYVRGFLRMLGVPMSATTPVRLSRTGTA